MKYKPANNKFTTAIVVNRGTNKVNHFFQKGTVVQPKIFDEDNRSYLCEFVSNGLPDRDQFVHEEDLINYPE